MSDYRLLFFLVEGVDDERFVQRVLQQAFRRQGYSIKIVPYAQKSHKQVNRLITSIRAMGADYILLADLNSANCVTQRKEKVKQKLSFCADDCIRIVIQEIESWYLAGLDERQCRKLKIPVHENTNDITKEQFNKLRPAKMIRLDFMIEVLKYFSVDTAVSQNASFAYFAQKHRLIK